MEVKAALLKCLFSAPAMEMSLCLDKRVRGRIWERRGGGNGSRSNEARPAFTDPALLHAREVYILRYEFKLIPNYFNKDYGGSLIMMSTV